MKSLLDVNVLIALFDPDHVHHDISMKWLRSQGSSGWATCPIIQNGCLRIMSQERYPNALPLAEVAQRLRQATESEYHDFIPDDISLLDATYINQSMLLNSRQLTDTYLLALAVQHGCQFVTLDQSIPISAATGATAQNLVVL